MVDTPLVNFAFPIAALGAVPRTLPQRFADYPSVMDFPGVDPSGSGDNAGAFAAAIAASTRFSKACGTVRVPRGNYNFLSKVPLIPGLTPGTANSFRIMGDSNGSTALIGNFNDFILDAGPNMAGKSGGFTVERLSFINNNLTPFTSGCLRLGGINPVVSDCRFSGMMGVNFVGATAAHVVDCFMSSTNGVKGGAPGVGMIGINMASNGGVIENTSFADCDIGFALSGSGIGVFGCHFETSRTGFALGYAQAGLGLGYLKGFVLMATSGEGVGILYDFQGVCTGSILAYGGQMHQDSDINPINTTTFKDRAYATLRIPDGLANGVTFTDGGGGTSDVTDPNGATFIIGLPPVGNVRAGGAYLRMAQSTSPSPITKYKLPGSLSGGAAVAGAANSARFFMGDFVPIWKYDDLPWGTLTGATISGGTTLAYGGSTRLTPEVGAVLKGTGVTPGTRIISIDPVAKTGVVDKTQVVSSTTITFFCNNTGDIYEIKDSPDPVWTSGGVSNGGKPVAAGGGVERAQLMFKDTLGYTLVG